MYKAILKYQECGIRLRSNGQFHGCSLKFLISLSMVGDEQLMICIDSSCAHESGLILY